VSVNLKLPEDHISKLSAAREVELPLELSSAYLSDLGTDIKLAKGFTEHGLRSALNLALHNDGLVGVEQVASQPRLSLLRVAVDRDMALSTEVVPQRPRSGELPRLEAN
jgi:hypothetical protein